MTFTLIRVLTSLFCMMNAITRNILTYNAGHPDFPLDRDQMEAITSKRLIYYLLWCLAGDARGTVREQLGNFIRGATTIALPPTGESIIDYEVDDRGEWTPWKNKVSY